jgi:citrate lyase subunit beta/citryl-CoA lyase
MASMRSLLFVPADNEEALRLAKDSAADVIVLDLEDNVAAAAKDAARNALRAQIEALKPAGRTVYVRVNNLKSGLTPEDLDAAVCPSLDGLVFPKTESGQQSRELDVLIRERELHGGVRPGTIVLIPQIESARGLLRCEEIILASNRIAGLSLGGRDFAADLGVPRSRDGRELQYARSVIATHCAAHRLQAIDAAFPDMEDAEGLIAHAEYARSIGFRGKSVLDARQVQAVNGVFSAEA